LFETVHNLYSSANRPVSRLIVLEYGKHLRNSTTARNQLEATSRIRKIFDLVLTGTIYLYLDGLIFVPWRLKRHVSSKRPTTSSRLYCIISQNIEAFIIATLRTSSHTQHRSRTI
jgi:hypothetical protein